MRRILMTTAALGFATIAGARPATAQVSNEQICLAGCASDFPGTDPVSVSIRGWCYFLRCE
jgi:hypothetical protein